MKQVKVIGVPEHFNLPWHLAIEEGAFEERGIDLQWTDIPEGTGRMCDMLEQGEADIAIVLTEGIVKKITEGLDARIVREYISTPLQWGIHVAAQSHYQKVEELRDARAAISRFGSGSHLMAFVNARQQGWDTKSLKFREVQHLEGAIEALGKKEADYFMWEHFTTKPLVDEGIFRRLADCPTPWPCFVIAASDRFLKDESSTLLHILEILDNYTREFRQIPSIDRTLANRYGQQLEDIRIWLSATRWSQKQISREVIDNVSNTLLYLKLIEEKAAPSDILWKK
ncbi:substrate-binding domain-containing protein [Zeaxanthinibacter enoshimensis]|uniref:ABC-type nitrate/sulfonate/bicarbonate transport system substrate-binding protein n=1 Tax=Zeaxanthinibacter enoshimensis TaxID=392009 RepID=A0A4R6TN70_9FLAO|nr:substrate-binding domain-containing protein [Zeaxanthinibacter enoshimensis]TDQ31338.1 ABC-type nitrate/sulfonate/bicarbonate transport system substrate-binding protein [Zeaxanthinibacter enoshimensis]